MITWRQWVAEASGGETAREIASKIGFSSSSVARWLRTGKPPCIAVVEVARAYHADIIVGLVVADIITVGDIQDDVENRLTFVPTRVLLAELLRRDDGGDGELNHALAPEWM